MRSAAALLLPLLGGCAAYTGTLIQENPPLTYTSKRLPPQVAACVAENMERILLAGKAEVRPLEKGDGLEVVAAGVGQSVYAVAQVSGSGGETSVDLWFSPILRILRGPQEMGMKFMLGC